MFTSFLTLEYLKTLPTIFKHYHLGWEVLSCLLQCKNHCKLSVLGCVLKLEVVEGRLRKDNLDFYYSSELMKCKSIYGYYDASITQKVVKPDTLDRV